MTELSEYQITRFAQLLNNARDEQTTSSGAFRRRLDMDGNHSITIAEVRNFIEGYSYSDVFRRMVDMDGNHSITNAEVRNFIEGDSQVPVTVARRTIANLVQGLPPGFKENLSEQVTHSMGMNTPDERRQFIQGIVAQADRQNTRD